MRDDLHKKAPIPRRAQHVLKMALREADRSRPERLQAAAERALDQAVRRSFSPATLRALADSTLQGDLFGAAATACSPSEGDFLSRTATEQSSRDALHSALDGWADSYVREARATLVAEGTVPNIGEVIGALSTAFGAAASAVTDAICSGDFASTAVTDVTLGEDLLAPGTRKAER